MTIDCVAPGSPATITLRPRTCQIPRCRPSESEQRLNGTMVGMAISMKKLSGRQTAAAIAIVSICVALTGCRKTQVVTALAPKASGPIKDLTAVRAGDEISLNWTTPRKGMSKLIVNGLVKMRVCRQESTHAECIEAGHPLLLAPAVAGTFTEELPGLMASGAPRVNYYSVELIDRNGRPTGLANRVPVLIGAPPLAVQGLTAEITEQGVLLRWIPESAATTGETTVRLRRTEGLPPVATQAMREGSVPFPTRPTIDLSATDGSASVIDPDTQKGTTYQYRAQRVFRIAIDGQTLEMDGQFSPEVQVELPQ